ncbi:MAG: COX15/CtaA family protein [Actinomycetota bacterium]|nr:COX15/CtaA family protein [Actinomycetota bacterium]
MSILQSQKLRISPNTFRNLALFALIGLSVIIVTGGAVRLTGSGLGCPDWPTCQGQQYVAQLSFHPMVEFVNRVITILMTIAVMVAVAAAFLRKPFRKDLAWLSFGMIIGLIAQIILGGITVLEKLAPPFVMAHFLLSLAIVFDALVLYKRAITSDKPSVPMTSRETIWLGRLMIVSLAAVLAIGTAVTGSGPHSGSPISPRLPFPLRAVAQLHADAVLFLVGLTLASLFMLAATKAPDEVQKTGRTLLWVMAGQAGLGYIQYFTKLPVLLVGFHIAGATLVWIIMIWHYLGFFARPIENAPIPFGTDSRSDLANA